MVRYAHLRGIEHHFDTLQDEWRMGVGLGVDGVVSDYMQHIPGNEAGGVVAGATRNMQDDLRKIVADILTKYRELKGELEASDQEVLIDHGKSMIKKYLSAVRSVAEQKAEFYGVAQKVKDRGQDLEKSIQGYYLAAMEVLRQGLADMLSPPREDFATFANRELFGGQPVFGFGYASDTEQSADSGPTDEDRSADETPSVHIINHDDGKFQLILEKLEKLEKAVLESNEVGSLLDGERIKAEVSATHRILLAPSVRTPVLDSLVLPVLKLLAKTFFEQTIGLMAQAILVQLCQQLSIPLPKA